MAIKYFLSLVLIVQSTLVRANEYEDRANKVIEDTHKAARKHAEALLMSDITNLSLAIANKLQKAPRNDGGYVLQTLSEYERNLQKETAKILQKRSFSSEELTNLIAYYRKVVRDRFAYSYATQELVYLQESAVRSFDLTFEAFENLCRSGRSELGVIQNIGALPSLPKAYYQFDVSVGSSFSINASAQNGNDEVKDLAQATATASAAAAAVPLPPWNYVAAAAIAVVGAGLCDAKIAEEQTKAEVAKQRIYDQSAKDIDVARYYRESCASTLKMIQPLHASIKKLYGNGSNPEIVAEYEGNQAKLDEYTQDSKNSMPSFQLIKLALYARNQQCEAGSTLCSHQGAIYTLLEDSNVTLDTEHSDAVLKSAKEITDAFNKKYPEEELLKLQNYQVVNSLTVNWISTMKIATVISFRNIDAKISQLANIVNAYSRERYLAENSQWALSKNLLSSDEKATAEFENLRIAYFNMLNTSLLVAFELTNRNQALASFDEFRSKFKKFADRYYANKYIREMSRAVASLEAFYASK